MRFPPLLLDTRHTRTQKKHAPHIPRRAAGLLLVRARASPFPPHYPFMPFSPPPPTLPLRGPKKTLVFFPLFFALFETPPPNFVKACFACPSPVCPRHHHHTQLAAFAGAHLFVAAPPLPLQKNAALPLPAAHHDASQHFLLRHPVPTCCFHRTRTDHT